MTGAIAFRKTAEGGRINLERRQEFLSLYPNRIQGILRPPGCKSWVTVSKHFPVGDDTIYGAIAETESNLWGLRFAEKTRFAVFDIDKDSRYHNVQQLQELIKELAEVGLTGTIYRSSDSGGWHVYLFFTDWENSQEIQNTLKVWLRANNYEIRNGIFEVFPSGMGLRLPLQTGFAWLDSSAEIIKARNNLTTDEAISHFLADLSARASNWSNSKKLIQSQLDALDRAGGDAQAHEKSIDTAGFEELFSYRLIPEKYQDGRDYWQNGLVSMGQRHDAIMAVEHYLWHGDSSLGVPALPGAWNDDGRFRLILAWLKQKHNGYCRHINRGNWRKVEAQITRCVKWRRPANTVQVAKPYPMTERSIERLMALSRSTGRTWSPDDLKKGNDGREEKTRAKIFAALMTLVQEGGWIGRNELARLSGCSPNSVSRHRDLWFLLVSGSGDQNPFLDPIQPLDEAATPKCVAQPLYYGSGEKVLPLVTLGDSGQTDLSGQPAHPVVPLVVVREDSSERAPIDLTPPSLLPGWEPITEHPASSPSPSGCFASLDAGALVRWYSGRGAGAAGGSEHAAGFVCYTCDIAGGITGREGATSRVVALASFWAKDEEKKTVLYATNYKFLTTTGLGYPSGIADEFSLIERQLSGVITVDVRDLSLLGKHFEVSLHQPAASAPEITSGCRRSCIRVYRFCIAAHVHRTRAHPRCRQLLGNCFEVSSDGDVRGPPKCRQLF